MITIHEIISTFNSNLTLGKKIERFELDWYETTKRVLRKNTDLGTDVALKRKNTEALNQDDILFIDAEKVILVEIKSCECIALSPKTMFEMGSICYDIGNKHIPIFLEDTEILIPYDKPTFVLFEKMGYAPIVTQRKLKNALRSNIPQHGHLGEKESFFNKIMQLTQ